MSEMKTVKIVTLGEAQVGKTSIIRRFIENSFSDKEESTIGAAFAEKTFNFGPASYRIQLYDTAGQERFNSIAKIYYQKADVALLIYDVTDAGSFATLQNWNAQVLKNAPNEVIRVVVGNKIDLITEEKVTTEEVGNFAKNEGALFMLTSAKEATGIQSLFEKVCLEVYEKKKSLDEGEDMTISIHKRSMKTSEQPENDTNTSYCRC